MNKKQAVSIIKEVFGSAFNRDSFISFSVNLLNLNQIDLINKNINIFDAYKQHVESLELVANFSDGKNEIDVLIVKLFKDTSLDKARTMQRNFVARYLDNKQSDAALVAFTSPNAQDWRFSLIKMDYKFKNTDTGIKIEQEVTPAKRWSFLVGKNENSHTAQSQLIDILLNDNNFPKLAELEQAFSIETVTNEFFKKYTELFLRMKEGLDFLLEKDPQLKTEFENKEIETSDFAKKTMGQMAFLYFLQKKGWFGVAPDKEWGTGVKNFLREVFERREKYGKNFFDDILEPLFYKALAQDRGNDSIYPELNNCRMPFLNGGLFEPMNGYSWETTHIRLPDELFSNETTTKEGDIGDGILDVFDRYNFTVNESYPLEQEVAVDPEMLGKVFENLLDVKDRKSKGAFYTPREIVHYMCQESLVNYLETKIGGLIPLIDIKLFIYRGSQIIENDKSIIEQGSDKSSLLLPHSIIKNAAKLDELLAKIKVCDPAVGSGAFPLGMLNEIVSARTLLSIHLRDSPSTYELKLHAISNSIYGVDIEPGAVEIAKLRFWLSLVVEEEKPSPLPNLEHKIMQGNALVSKYEGIELFDDDFLNSAESIRQEKNEIQGQLNEIQKEYFSLHENNEFTTNRKLEIERVIKQLQRRERFLNNKDRNSEETLGLFENNSAKELAQKNARLLQTKIAQYVTIDGKTLKENLKLEIDNLKWDLIEATLEERNEIEKLDRIKVLRKDSVKPFFIWKLEFGEVFKNNGGFDIVIANPPYIQLQKRVNEGLDVKHADLYAELGYKTFKRTGDIYALFYELAINLLKSNGHLTYITSNKWMRAVYGDNLRSFLAHQNPKLLIDLSGIKVFESAIVDVNIIIAEKTKNQNKLHACQVNKDYRREDRIEKYFEKNKIELNNLTEDSWVISSQKEISIKQKIEQVGTPLRDWDVNIYRGILTGYNNAFIIDESQRNKLLSKDPKNEDIIKPIVRGRDIDRYGFKFSGLYLINTHSEYYDKDGNRHKEINIEQYPSIKEHLDDIEFRRKSGEFGAKEQEGKGLYDRSDRGTTPYNLRSCKYIDEFSKDKIAFPVINRKWSFPFVEGGYYILAPMRFLTTNSASMLYLGSIIRSSLMQYYWKIFAIMQDDSGYQMDSYMFEKLPIAPVNSSTNKIVDKIETLAEKLIDVDISGPHRQQLEVDIDNLVFQLYGLTPEEISLVFNSTN